MIKLYGFGNHFGLADVSPFVLKVMAFMRMHNIEYEYIADQQALGKAPKKKLPFIDHDGHIVCDSTDIIDYLTEKFQLSDAAELSATQQAEAQLISKSLDEHFYWFVVYSRWFYEPGWQQLKPVIFKAIPAPLRGLIAMIIRRGVKKALWAQGTSRHSEAELLAQLDTCLSSLAAMLGDKAYFYGEQPSRFDASAYAFLVGLTHSDFEGPFCDKAKQYPTLVEYCERFSEKFF